MDASTQLLFEQLSRHIAEPLLVVAATGSIAHASALAEQLLGVGSRTLIGQPLANYVADAADKVTEYLGLCARTMSPLPGALRVRAASAREVVCRCQGARLTATESRGGPALVLLRVTPKHETGHHSAFVLLNQKIEDLSREVTNRKRAEQAALQAIRVRDEFLSIASHELRTPIQSLMLQLDLITRTVESIEESSAKRLTSRVSALRRQVERLAALGATLLDVSAMHSHALKLELEPVDFGECVRAGVETSRNDLARAGCKLQLDVPAAAHFAMLDPCRLGQVLVNLLTNASKYGGGKPVAVAVTGDEHTVRVSVTDTGIGIAPENVERIFEKFGRAVSSENYGGLGLGLFISKHLVEAMGGSISVSTALGRGSTFTVKFPRLASARRPATLAPVDSEGDSRI